ncbi:ubiquitin-conjugating enzyme family protein [Stylonychia lemnae]|uniref:Ubiquitin-conjugating enzyme family protein n=1 Tax=Stylonychia lemnae TaxID=5949 RepID=A0A078ACW0_STYLE|nr:ubiquitin-conjugating enzyme family protein [Stylonychia lemnae]|eukprot:CDW80044.1 ubiquitin-conjugating enzyme family protein [Stylonychia lemnae]
MESNSKSELRNNFIKSIEKTRPLNYSEKRIILDLEEMEEKVDPQLGISALPLKDNIMVWHANITGPEGSPYDGSILHLEITFPKDYPNNAPQIKQLHPFSSPFFDNQVFSSEITESDWCSGYSTFSILMQIQCCLFDFEERKEDKIKKEMKNVKDFKCNGCDHDMKANKIWPPFTCILEGGPKTFASLTEEEKLIDETFCFHTRLNVKQTMLGTGIAFSKLARTKQINSIFTTVDLVSQKAFKEGLRKALNKKRFSHWIPLFFGDQVTNQEKQLENFRKSLSLLVTNRSDQFDESLILKTLPYMMLTHAIQALENIEFSSIKGLRMFLMFHRAFLFLLDHHPNVRHDLEVRIKKFIESEECRHKKHTSDLGVLMACLSVSDNHNIESIKQVLLFESLDRKVFWTMLKVPEYANIEQNPLTAQGLKDSFNLNQKSFQLQLLFHFFVSQLLERGQDVKDFNDIKSEYDKRYCRLDPKIEEAFQKEIKAIQKVDSYEEFFQRLGFPSMKQEKLNQVLRQAFINSKNKNYHGGIENAFPLEDSDNRVVQIVNEEGLFKFNDQEDAKESDEDFISSQFQQRYPQVQQYRVQQERLLPGQISDLIALQRTQKVDVQKLLKDPHFEVKIDQFIQNNKQLLAKLDTEYALYLNQFSTDIKQFYENVLPIIKENEVQSLDLSLKVISANKIMIKELGSLKKLSIRANIETQDFAKDLMSLINESGSFELQELSIVNTEPKMKIALSEHLTDFISTQKNTLKTLRIEYFEIGSVQALALLNCKVSNLEVLEITDCQIPIESTKAIQQTVKLNLSQLRQLDLSRNTLNASIWHVLNVLPECTNLQSFSMQGTVIEEIDSKRLERRLAEIISKTQLQKLNMKESKAQITQGLIQAISQSALLDQLNISQCKYYPGFLSHLGKMITERAAMKKPLRMLSLSDIETTELYQATEEKVMITSEEESKAIDGLQLPQGFNLSLENITDTNIKGLNYGMISETHSIQIKNSKVPLPLSSLLHIFGQQRKFKIIQLQDSQLPDQNNYKYKLIKKICQNQTQVEFLNLSNLKLGVREAACIRDLLKNSDKIKSLYLKGNSFGVEGARILAEGLKVNSSLDVLDLGHNRLRNKGCTAIAKAILEEGSQSQLKVLFLKNNFIADKSFKEIVKMIAERCGPLANLASFQLKGLFLAGNDTSLFEIKRLQKNVLERRVDLFVDSFDRIKRNLDECLFISDVNITTISEDKILKKLQSNIKNVIVKEIKIGRAKKTAKTKGHSKNNFMFVNFDHQNAIPQALKIDRQLNN